MSKLHAKRVLVIDDLEDMRKQLKLSMRVLGFGKMDFASSAKEALAKIAETEYDIILCDYNMGESMDGQQLLEYLRVTNRIPATTLFVMITAESTYDKVVTASEYVPDTYVLKPFTGQTLGERLEKLVDRQDVLQPLQSAIDDKNAAKVIAEADKLLRSQKYVSEAIKAKGEVLLSKKSFAEAAALYAPLAQRGMPWAMYGQALATRGMDDVAGTLTQLNALISASPLYLSAYDLQADVLLNKGDARGAFDALKKASDISPNSLHRARVVSRAASQAGDHAAAEEVMETILNRYKYSPLKRATDYTTLSKSKAVQGKTDEALKVLKTAGSEFKDPTDAAIISVGEVIAYKQAGNEAAAAQSLAKATAINPGQLPIMAVAALAEACYALGREAEGEDMLKQIIQNNPDSHEAKHLVRDTLKGQGKAHLAEELIASSEKEVISLNNQGVHMAAEGKLEEAVQLLCAAADRLPNNQTIVGNAAYCLSMTMLKRGHDAAMHEECLKLRDLLAGKNPKHPRLSQIDTILAKVK